MRRLPRPTFFPYTTLFRSVDDVVPPNEIVDRTEVRVEVLANDYDPDGSREALEVSVPGDQDGVRAVDNQVEVQLTDNRQVRSEEHTSELQSRGHLVCRLLLEK